MPCKASCKTRNIICSRRKNKEACNRIYGRRTDGSRYKNMKKNGYSFSRSICLSVRIVMLVILFTVLAPTAANAADRETHNYDDLRIYQIMVASFNDGDSSIGYDSIWGSATLQNPGGDIQGIIDALDYIKGTGVNAIWLTPVFTSEGSEETADGT